MSQKKKIKLNRNTAQLLLNKGAVFRAYSCVRKKWLELQTTDTSVISLEELEELFNEPYYISLQIMTRIGFMDVNKKGE